MKSSYKRIKWQTIIISIISSVIFSCGSILLYFQYFKINDFVPVRVFVYGDKLSTEVQEKINNSIISNIENIYDRLLANIQSSITLFSIMLFIFTIVFGMIYFSKLRDAEKLMTNIQKTPSMFFKQFYQEQYKDNMLKLLSQNPVIRNDAVNKLSFNPEIKKNDYNDLYNVLLKEFDYDTNIYFHQNVSAIINILIKLNYSKTIKLLKDILQKTEYDHMKHYNMLSYVIADNSDETKDYIKEQLLKEGQMSNQILFSLANNRVLVNYMDFIFEKSNDSILQMVLSMLYSDTWHINIDNLFIQVLKREDIGIQSLQHIISLKLIDIKEKIRIVLYFYAKNKEKFEQSLIFLVSSIHTDENAKKDFLVITEDKEYHDMIYAFFTKNEYLKSYFTKLQSITIKQMSDEKKQVPDIIKEHELHYIEDENIVVDKEGKKNEVGIYSYSSFTGAISPVKYGIMKDGVFIDIEKIKELKL